MTDKPWIEPPSQVNALRDIRLCLDEHRFADALAALRNYGEMERAYALAVIERQRNEVRDDNA